MSVGLTEACWPVFEFMTNFIRQVKHHQTREPEQVRYEALTALRDAADLARNEPVTERNWEDRVKSMMVYLIDYVMINGDWPGRNYWFQQPFETDPQVLNHPQALGGEQFFEDCNQIQQEYELAERRDRRDKDELAELLSLYFVCLRLGFRGQYHDRPQELADYTRRLYMRLPAYSSTRANELFPEAYKHNQELKVDYRLGLGVSVVLTVFAVIVIFFGVSFRYQWSKKVEKLEQVAANPAAVGTTQAVAAKDQPDETKPR